jgi:hypothetical protein
MKYKIVCYVCDKDVKLGKICSYCGSNQKKRVEKIEKIKSLILDRFICTYEKMNHQEFALKLGCMIIGRYGSYGRKDSWWHLGSTYDTPEAKTCGKSQSIIEARNELEKAIINSLKSISLEKNDGK